MDTYNGQAQSGSGQKIPLGMYRVGGAALVKQADLHFQQFHY